MGAYRWLLDKQALVDCDDVQRPQGPVSSTAGSHENTMEATTISDGHLKNWDSCLAHRAPEYGREVRVTSHSFCKDDQHRGSKAHRWDRARDFVEHRWSMSHVVHRHEYCWVNWWYQWDRRQGESKPPLEHQSHMVHQESWNTSSTCSSSTPTWWSRTERGMRDLFRMTQHRVQMSCKQQQGTPVCSQNFCSRFWPPLTPPPPNKNSKVMDFFLNFY